MELQQKHRAGSIEIKRELAPSMTIPKTHEAQQQLTAAVEEDSAADGSTMAPRPDDDLFIEPADDYDVVYGAGDFNSTMEDSSSVRPYIRLTANLRNLTREAGQSIRLKCEAAGSPPPLTFTWLRNHAPLEKNKRIKLKNREYWSRLSISQLDVLDSGYYQCVVHNPAGSVNTTSVIRVTQAGRGQSKLSNIPSMNEDDLDADSLSHDRFPSVSGQSDDWSDADLTDSQPGDMWLEAVRLRKGECIEYKGQACKHYLGGQYIMITTTDREEMLDIDRNLRAAMMFIESSPEISADCKRHSHAVACYHKYHVCDRRLTGASTVSICKSDCDRLKDDICPKEMALAAQHDLVGDGPKMLLPNCDSLEENVDRCIPVLQPLAPSAKNPMGHQREHLIHWCYVGSGKTYQGTANVTQSKAKCRPWAQSKSRYNPDNFPILKTAKNYCRNPESHKTRPWCYSEPNDQEEYCDVNPCPEGMYPHLVELENSATATPTEKSLSDGVVADVVKFWQDLPSQWQYAAMGGAGVLSFLILLLICMCCCRRRGKKRTTNTKKNGQTSLNGSLMNSATNGGAYYRKLNGSSTANQSNAAFELSSLLPPPPGHSPPPPMDHDLPPEIPFDRLELIDMLGEGQFGKVMKGNLRGYGLSEDSEPLQVAIKTLKEDSLPRHRADFAKEVRYTARLRHPNVVELIGVCSVNSEPTAAIFEYMIHGDLHEFLRLRAPPPNVYANELAADKERIASDHEDFLHIATQIAAGMEYLAGMGYVHRDVAARNILVTDRRVIKIADFGLMRDCYEKDYYQMQHRTMMPVRWMPPEALVYGKFSEASDVWAFGVTVWEIYSYGRQPHEGFDNQQVIELIRSRNLLENPTNCPTRMYSLMVECWHENPTRRPRFTELHGRLQTWSVMSSPAQSSAMSGPYHPARPSSAHSGGGSSTAQQGRASRQSSAHSTSLVGVSNGGRGAAGGYVPSPAPMQTVLSLNGVHPYHNGRSPAAGKSRASDGSPLMRRPVYHYSEDGESD